MLRNILLVGLGGGIGSMIRYACWLLLHSRSFPYATLTVNILGSFIIGLLLALGIKEAGLTEDWKLFLATGICGGFTTFSAFSAENMMMLQSGKYTMAFLYIGLSLVAGVGAAWVGFRVVNAG